MESDITELKPVSNIEKETDNSALIADAWRSKQVTHVLVCFVITSVVVILISFFGPSAAVKSSSKSRLPVYAKSGPFDMKLSITKVSPFNNKIKIFAQFTLEDYAQGQKPFVTNATLLFTPKQANKTLSTRSLKFYNATFDYSSSKMVELFEETHIYFNSLELVASFEKGCENCKEIEFATEYSTVSSTFYDMWTRLSFTIALTVILFRSSTYNFISYLPYKFYTYLLVFIVILANNPLHMFSFTMLNEYFYYFDQIIQILEQSYIVFYSLWIMQTLAESQSMAALFGIVCFSLIGYNFYNEYFPEIAKQHGFEITKEMEMSLYSGSILILGLIHSMIITNDLPDLQERARRIVYLVTILVIRIPYYCITLIPSGILPSSVTLAVKFLSNNIFAAMMLFMNLKLPAKALNSYADPSEAPPTMDTGLMDPEA